MLNTTNHQENANQAIMRYGIIPVRVAIAKNTRNNKRWWGTGEGEHSCSVGRNVNEYSHYGKRYGESSKKVKIEVLYDPAVPLLGIFLKKTKALILKDLCAPMFTAVLLTTAKIWKQLKCPWTDEWIKMRHVHIMKYY